MAGQKHPRHYEESFKRQMVQLRERQAGARDQGRVRHLAFRAAHRSRACERSYQKAADNRTPEQNELIELRQAQRQVGDGGGRFRTGGAGLRTENQRSMANAAVPISAQCRILGVPRSHLLLDDRTSRSRAGAPITGDVHAIWRDSHERCGAGKIKAALERRSPPPEGASSTS